MHECQNCDWCHSSELRSSWTTILNNSHKRGWLTTDWEKKFNRIQITAEQMFFLRRHYHKKNRFIRIFYLISHIGDSGGGGVWLGQNTQSKNNTVLYNSTISRVSNWMQTTRWTVGARNTNPTFFAVPKNFAHTYCMWLTSWSANTWEEVYREALGGPGPLPRNVAISH